MLAEDFNHTIDSWIAELDRYDFDALCKKPSTGSWSVGQVYMHVISQAAYFIEQAERCSTHKNHATRQASAAGKEMLRNNQFPDAILEGPPSNAHTPQPAGKKELLDSLLLLKNEFGRVMVLMSTSPNKGKTKHPGLQYFSAMEWLQFADMHFSPSREAKEPDRCFS